MDLNNYIRDIPDFPKEGIVFKDITPLLQSPEAFQYVIDRLASHYENEQIDAIIGVESRGFIFGAPLALRLKLPFIPARKPGKLPYKTVSESYELEYGEASLEIHQDAVGEGDRILILDDLLATGGTMEACGKLVEQLGGEVAGYGAVTELAFLNGRDRLGGQPFFTILSF